MSSAAATLTSEDLARIADQSARRNGEKGLTGLLIHQGGAFFGVLEGPRRRLLARMEAIVVDPRHRGVVVLREEEVRERRFQNWHFTRLPSDMPLEPPMLAQAFLRNLGRRNLS